MFVRPFLSFHWARALPGWSGSLASMVKKSLSLALTCTARCLSRSVKNRALGFGLRVPLSTMDLYCCMYAVFGPVPFSVVWHTRYAEMMWTLDPPLALRVACDHLAYSSA